MAKGSGMTNDKVTVASPATISNLGSGFDVFGLALDEPFDVIDARIISGRNVIIDDIVGPGAESITRDPARNSAGAAALAVLESSNADFGIELRIKKGIRPYSGIGSSGASAAGGAFVANLLLDSPLPMEELVRCAAKAEQITSGSFHADNVGPAILGGFTIVKSYDPFRILRMNVPNNLGIIVTMPNILVDTKEARKVLPQSVPLSSMVYEVGNAASLVLGMCREDISLIGDSMRDIVIEPARASLNPHIIEAEQAARDAGAAGAFLGGSGPCLIAIFDRSITNGDAIASAVREVYTSNNIEVNTWITRAGQGCRRL